MEKAAERNRLKTYFDGNWFFKRNIFDDNERLYGVANGLGYFTSLDERKLVYKEEGNLSLTDSGQVFAFSRSFIYVFDGDHLEIFFNDGENSGQSYQRYNLVNDSVLTSVFPHVCKADYYDGSFSITSSNNYKLETLIMGPNKKNRIETYANRT